MSGSTRQNVAEYRWEERDDDGSLRVYEKWIAVEYDESADELTVSFRVAEKADSRLDRLPGTFDGWHGVDWTRADDETLEWYRFLELMDAMKGGADGEGGREFVASVFVGGASGPAAVGTQGVVVGENPTVAQPQSAPDENDGYLHVYYQTEDDPETLKMRRVQGTQYGNRPDEGGPSGPHYHWEVRDHELQQLLVRDPDTDDHVAASEGFTHEFRETLFLHPRRHHVIEML